MLLIILALCVAFEVAMVVISPTPFAIGCLVFVVLLFVGAFASEIR